MYIRFNETFKDKDIKDYSGTWYAALIKTRQERKLVADFKKLKINFYLPLSKVIIRKKDKVDIHYRNALFSYIFFTGNDLTRYLAAKTNRLVRVIDIHDQDKFIKQLSSFQESIRKNPMVLAFKKLKVGQEYCILSGVYKDRIGTLTRIGSKCQLEISDGYSLSLTLEVDPENLAQVEKQLS